MFSMENKSKIKMKTQVFRAKNRGKADYGWLKANYSFSFANYYNPDAVQFGTLRVLNDDEIAPAMGFNTHPHDNMEIITIPLEGALKHKDSMSDEWKYVKTGEVQVMSAGSGLQHSEMNGSTTEKLRLFQIWIIPNEKNVTPRYDQKAFNSNDRKNKLQVLVSSINSEIHQESLKIHQDAVISRINLDKGETFKYKLKSKTHGVYAMTIYGTYTIDGKLIETRDAVGVSNIDSFELVTNEDTELLFIEVPMVIA